MSNDEQWIEIVRYWWEKAWESLGSARREITAKSYSFAVNRLYYAVFYGASAALFDKKLSFKKHSGVRASFHREFIKTGLLNEEWGKIYDQLFEDRHESDYIALVEFEHEYVENQYTLCNRFLNELKPLISSL
jgi:hypothetical protein